MNKLFYALLGLIAGVIIGYMFVSDKCDTSIFRPDGLVMLEPSAATPAECSERAAILERLSEENRFGGFTASASVNYDNCPVTPLVRNSDTGLLNTNSSQTIDPM